MKIDMKLFNEWLQDRPPVIKDLAAKYPPDVWYIVKTGAPYGVCCAGTKVFINSYREDGWVGVVVLAKNKLPAAIEHEKMLGHKHNHSEERIAEFHKRDIAVEIDPRWLYREDTAHTNYSNN